MMLMQVTCPHCGARYQFERSLIPQAGYDAQCANCSGIFVVAPDASGSEAPIALPSMSMVDTWLAPPALAPKSARNAAAERGATGQGEPEVRDVTPRSKSTQASVSTLPRGGRQAAVPSVAPGETAALQFSIACPSCETVYAFAVNELPLTGVDAPCSQCAAVYRLTRAGDPAAANDGMGASALDAEAEAAAEALRPIDPTVLEDSKLDTVGGVLASDVPVTAGDRLSRLDDDDDEPTAPNGGVLEAMHRATTKFGLIPEDEDVDRGSYDDRETDPRRLAPRGRGPNPDASELTTDELPIQQPRAQANDGEPTTVDLDDEVTRPFGRGLLATSATQGSEDVSSSDSDEARALIDAPTVVEARPGPRPSGVQVKVPLAGSERSRAGAGSWGPPDPQKVMRSRVRASRDTRERLKARRPPFDDDDVQRLRRDAGGLIRDPREFDDEDGFLARLGLLRGEHRVLVSWVAAVILALSIIFAVVPLLTGRSVLHVLNLRVGSDPRVRELLDRGRAALLTDTEGGYRDTLKLANEVLDIDAGDVEARVLFGLAAVFRGIDLRSAAQNMVAEGEVVQSSQMLAGASAELAHARRVLSRKNDESADLAFTAGIYYALDEDQREHARDAFVRGLRRAHVDGSSPAPTAFAAYLQATLRNLDGDAAGARASLERAMDLEPHWQRPRFELARLEAVRGEVGRARVLLAQVLAAQETHTKARELLAALPDTPADPGAGQAKPSTVAQEPAVKPAPPPSVRPTKAAKADSARPDSGKVDAAKDPSAVEQGKTPPDQGTKPPDGATKPDARPNTPAEIQTPPDAPTIIRGAAPPFQPPPDTPPPEQH